MTKTPRSPRHAAAERAIAGQKVWIIGASSGIGAATARELQARGAHVVISARREDKLQEVSEGRMTCVTLDASDRDAVRDALVAASGAGAGDAGAPDLVIYCAGYWKQTPKGTFDAEEFERHVSINLMGLANVIDACTPAFVTRGSGTLVGVASVAGYRGVPGGEYYGATKAAMINLLEALRGSLRPKGVDVVTVCPGFVKTDMTESNDFPMPFAVSAERAAREIVDGLEEGKQEIVFPKRMMAAMKAARLVPVRAWTMLVGR